MPLVVSQFILSPAEGNHPLLALRPALRQAQGSLKVSGIGLSRCRSCHYVLITSSDGGT